MKNTITDLSNILFEELERLNDEDLDEDELKVEFHRAKAIADVAGELNKTFDIQLDAVGLALDNGYTKEDELKVLPKQLVSKNI